MALDYTNPDQPVNFRDVGEWINLLAGQEILPHGCLLRGGTLRHVAGLTAFGSPQTILNLQKGPDPVFAEAMTHHFPISNDYEKYQTTTPEVRAWLKSILAVVAAGVERPIYVHCLSGKDRTGVVIATFLAIHNIDRDLIIEEYLLSDGEVAADRIETALDGILPCAERLSGLDLAKVRDQLFGQR